MSVQYSFGPVVSDATIYFKLFVLKFLFFLLFFEEIIISKFLSLEI